MSNSNAVMSTPKTIHIAITGRCNLQCKYCFYADEMTALGDLTTETWLNFFDQARQARVINVVLTGGEVFTRPDLWELIDGLITNHIRYALLSNGTLITEKTLQQFQVGKRRIRLDYIQLSVDGSTAEIHNKSRPNSFDRTMRGLRLLREANFPVVIRVTVNRHNVHDLENIMRLLIEDLNISQVGTNSVMPVGMGCQYQSELTLGPQDEVLAMEKLQLLSERYPGRIGANAGPLANVAHFEAMRTAAQTGIKDRRTSGYLTACGCIFSEISVLHNGAIVPCNMLPDSVMGNIQTDDLVEIWRHHPILEAMRNRSKISMQEIPGCSDCEWAGVCNGGCPGLAYQLTGDMNRAEPTGCYRRFLNQAGQYYAKSR